VYRGQSLRLVAVSAARFSILTAALVFSFSVRLPARSVRLPARSAAGDLLAAISSPSPDSVHFELRRIHAQDPQGGQILSEELSVWERYRWQILGAIALVGTQSALIAALILQRSRRRQTERRNSAILRALPDLMFLQTRDGVYLDYHAPDPNLLLLPPGQFLGRRMRDVLPPVVLRELEPAFAQAADASGPVVVEYPLDLAHGPRRFEARMVRNNDQILTLVRDITERTQAEAAVRESAQRYALATTAGAVGAWDRNLDTNDLYVDATLKSILGFEETEIPDRVDDWKARAHPDDAAVMTRALASISDDTDMYEAEHRMVHKDGSLRWFLSRGSVMRRKDGTPYRMIGTSLDITERKRSAELFRLALETVTTGMLMIDRTGRIVLVNAHVERLFGYQREELINETAEMLVPERLRGILPGIHGDVPADDTAVPMPESREIYGLHKDGTEIPIRIGFSPLRTSEGDFALCSIADISEQRQAEREREDLTRHLQDLAGRLIAAQEVERARIARDLHDDVSQQLAALSIALSGLKRRVAAMWPFTDVQTDLSSLEQRTRTLAESVRDLSRELHPDVLRHVGLAGSLTTYCRELSLSHALTVTCSAEGDFESIDAEAALCLYRIAQEALHNVVKHAHATKAEVRLHRTGDSAEITIADNGRGFDLQVRKSSVGLGLTSIAERARLAGGDLTVVTVLNEGTRVRVQVPIKTRATTEPGDLPHFRDDFSDQHT
jgi:PAS domain S-box-containing protein